MRRLLSLFAAAATVSLAGPTLAANASPDPAWFTAGKCQAVCGAEMWMRNHPPEVVKAADVCLFSLRSAHNNEKQGIAAFNARDARTGNMFIARRTEDIRSFQSCVNEGIRRRNFNLYAEQRGLDGGTGYDDGGLSALHGQLTLEGSPVFVSLGEGHQIGDYVEGDLSSVDGLPIRFSRARGQIVGGDRFRVDWVTRTDGTRVPVGRTIPLRTGPR